MKLNQTGKSSTMDLQSSQRRIVQLVRVSSKSQADKLTPENQRTILDAMLTRYSGILVCRIEDGAAGLSGGNALKDRPDLLKLFSLLRERAVDEVQVVALDRLSRSDDMIERAMVLQAVRDAGAVIRTGDGTVTDPSTQTGELMGSLSLLFSSWEKGKIRDRTLAGRLRNVAAGKPGAGNLPYGYRYDKSTQTWSIVPAEAETVRLIFKLAADGLGVERIGQRLHEIGKRSRRGIPLGTSAVRFILHQTAYAGTWTQTYAGRAYEATVPPIIAPQQFHAVQKVVEGRRSRGGAPSVREVLCRGLLYCSCGRTMHVSVKRSHPIYHCASRRQRGNSCGNPSFRAEPVDVAVWTGVVAKLFSPDLLAEAVRGQSGPADTATWEAQLTATRKALERVSRRAAALAEARADGVISDTDYRQRMDGYQREKTNLEKTQAAGLEGIANAKAWGNRQTVLSEQLKMLRASLASEATPFSIRQDALRALVPQELGCGITLMPDGRITIQAVLGDGGSDGGETARERGRHSSRSTRSVTVARIRRLSRMLSRMEPLARRWRGRGLLSSSRPRTRKWEVSPRSVARRGIAPSPISGRLEHRRLLRHQCASLSRMDFAPRLTCRRSIDAVAVFRRNSRGVRAGRLPHRPGARRHRQAGSRQPEV